MVKSWNRDKAKAAQIQVIDQQALAYSGVLGATVENSKRVHAEVVVALEDQEPYETYYLDQIIKGIDNTWFRSMCIQWRSWRLWFAVHGERQRS